jgi:hypothetical protein
VADTQDFLSWLPQTLRTDALPANESAPARRRRLQLSRDAVRKSRGTPWRVSAKVIIPDSGGNATASTNVLAAATGTSVTEGSAVTNATVVTYVVPAEYVAVVESVILRPGDDLAWDLLEFALLDGGASGGATTSGRVEQVLNREVLVFPDRSGVLPVFFAIGGPSRANLQVTTNDAEAPHYLEVEMRGWLAEAAQFRENPC